MVQAKILETGRDGRTRARHDVPEKFIAGPAPSRTGLRHNSGFEGATASPSGVFVFGAEASLAQDGDVVGFDRPAFCRLVTYRRDGSRLVPGAEYVYPIGPAARTDLVDAYLDSGLVEIVALSDVKLLALERDFLSERGPDAAKRRTLNRARIFTVELVDATDVSGVRSLAEASDWRPVRKELLLDFDDILPRLADGYRIAR